jgi:hypothetical protein
VTEVNRNAALATGALLGAAAAFLFGRRPRIEPGAAPPATPPSPDPRAAELRQKLAEAQRAPVDEEDFDVAGMGAETVVVEEGPPPAPRQEEPAAKDEFEAMRRRVHEEGRAAAEEMRRRAESEPS